jgi:catechol 2,3-dioxygenase-like lactoylglutathione lyase family enzyme
LTPNLIERDMHNLVQHREGPMRVKRIVANIASADVAKAKSFYADFLGLNLVMDHGWIVTYAAAASTLPQVSIASEGGSGTPVTDLSIEVDDLDEALRRARACGLNIEYGPKREEWGVRRFYVRDPFGRLVNILIHSEP